MWLLRHNEFDLWLHRRGLPLHPGVNMAETLDHRDKVQRSLEDIHRSLVAVSMKLAQLQLDGEIDIELGNALEEQMTALAPLTEAIESLESAISDGDQPPEERGRNPGLRLFKAAGRYQVMPHMR